MPLNDRMRGLIVSSMDTLLQVRVIIINPVTVCLQRRQYLYQMVQSMKQVRSNKQHIKGQKRQPTIDCLHLLRAKLEDEFGDTLHVFPYDNLSIYDLVRQQQVLTKKLQILKKKKKKKMTDDEKVLDNVTYCDQQ